MSEIVSGNDEVIMDLCQWNTLLILLGCVINLQKRICGHVCALHSVTGTCVLKVEIKHTFHARSFGGR